MEIFFYILGALGSYVLGSCPFGRILGHRAAGIDITTLGSGNIGATNVAREIGLRWGIATLCLDVLKGVAPVAGFTLIASGGKLAALGLGLFALAGHQFSVFQQFRGGKGVATSLGIYLGLSPSAQLSCAVALLVFLFVMYLSDTVSLASLLSLWSVPALLFFFGEGLYVVSGSLLIAILVSWKHKENLIRLARREERKWTQKGHGQESKSKSLSSSSSE